MPSDVELQSVHGYAGLTGPFYFLTTGLSARVPECQKINKSGLDQYDAERFGRLILPQSKKCGTERVNINIPVECALSTNNGPARL